LLAVALVAVTKWFRSKSLPHSLVMAATLSRVRVGPTMVTDELFVDSLL